VTDTFCSFLFFCSRKKNKKKCFLNFHLKFQHVRELSFLERESGLQVSLQEGSLFDDGKQVAVDGFLIGSLRFGESPSRPLDLVGSFRKFSRLDKLAVSMLGFPRLLLLFARFLEILVVDLGIELQAGDVDLG